MSRLAPAERLGFGDGGQQGQQQQQGRPHSCRAAGSRVLGSPGQKVKTRHKQAVKHSQISKASSPAGSDTAGSGDPRLLLPAFGVCTPMCASMHVHGGCAGQPRPQTGSIGPDVENTELQALPFCSFLILVVKGQVSRGNWKADKWDPLRGALHALAAQTSQPLTLALDSL